MRFNSIFRLLSLFLHGLMLIVGIFMIILCLYVIFADWGNLSPSFFLATGIMIGLVGCIVILTSKIGTQGIKFQMRTFGLWSGQRILIYYAVLELLALVAVLYLIVYAQSTIMAFEDNYQALESGDINVSFAPFEYTLSDKFNSFFFGAINGCLVQYEWFWKIVDRSCPAEMHSSFCQACSSYSITMCLASESVCYGGAYENSSSGSSIDNPGCPYTLCRAGMLRFMSGNSFTRGFLGLLVAFAVVQFLNVLVSVKLGTFEFRNVGTIRVVPIDGYDEDIITITAPPAKLYTQSDDR